VEFVQNNILLFVVAFVSGAMLLWPAVRRGAGGPWVDTTEATRLINREDALLLDVRDASDFAGGHALGAKNIPLSQIESRLVELDKFKGKPIVVLCQSGNTSSKALGPLRAKGFEKLANLSGGFAAWRAAGLPVEKK